MNITYTVNIMSTANIVLAYNMSTEHNVLSYVNRKLYVIYCQQCIIIRCTVNIQSVLLPLDTIHVSE